jgi:hypothetical protein
MKKLLKYVVCLAILVMVVVLLTGCEGKVTGGGWFINECGEGTKCTFGFNAQGEYDEDERCGVYKGQFQFNDHNGTKIHIREMTYLMEIFGAYNFTGYDKEGYLVNVTVTDEGEPGVDAGDGILIVHPHYGVWFGVLGGGNIQIHEED